MNQSLRTNRKLTFGLCALIAVLAMNLSSLKAQTTGGQAPYTPPAITSGDIPNPFSPTGPWVVNGDVEINGLLTVEDDVFTSGTIEAIGNITGLDLISVDDVLAGDDVTGVDITASGVASGNTVSATTTVAAGTTVTGGTGVVATTGNVTASAGDVSAFDDVLAGDAVTATGNVTGANLSGTNTGDVTLAASATPILGLTGQDVSFDTQTANTVIAGPASGGAAAPTARALVQADLPTAFPSWTKYTVTFADLAINDPNNSIVLFSLPARGVIHSVVIKQSQNFEGGAIATYTLSVGPVGTETKYANAYEVFSAEGNTVFQISSVVGAENFGAATNIMVSASADDQALDTATQGSADIFVLTSVTPAVTP